MFDKSIGGPGGCFGAIVTKPIGASHVRGEVAGSNSRSGFKPKRASARQLRTERQMAHGTNVGEPTALLAHASRRPKKLRRALVIDDRMPDAARDAGSNAILGHMRALIALGYQVEFVATSR